MITSKHHDKHRLRLISSLHAVDHRNQDIYTVNPPTSDQNIHWIKTFDSNIGTDRTLLTPNWNNNAAMVKYTIATLQAMVGAKPTGPINKIHKQPNFSTLWHSQRQIFNGIRKVGNVKSSLDVHT